MVRRWLLSHDAGVNSAAKPMGHIKLVCGVEFAFLSNEAEHNGRGNPSPTGLCKQYTKPSESAKQIAGMQLRSKLLEWEGTRGQSPLQDWRAVCCPDASVSDVGYIYPIKFFEEGYKFRVAELGENFLERKFPCIVLHTQN